MLEMRRNIKLIGENSARNELFVIQIGIGTKLQESFSNLVLFRAILGPFQFLLKPFFEASG